MTVHYYYYLILYLFLFSCAKKKDDYREIKGVHEGAVHLYLNSSDTGASLLSTIKKGPIVEKSYGSYGDDYHFSYRNHLAVSTYYGILFYNSDTAIFYKVIGALGISYTDSNSFTVISSIGIASFNVENDTLRPISFTFNYPGAPRIMDRIRHSIGTGADPLSGNYNILCYFMCPTGYDKIIYGWDIGEITDPKCYSYERY